MFSPRVCLLSIPFSATRCCFLSDQDAIRRRFERPMSRVIGSEPPVRTIRPRCVLLTAKNSRSQDKRLDQACIAGDGTGRPLYLMVGKSEVCSELGRIYSNECGISADMNLYNRACIRQNLPLSGPAEPTGSTARARVRGGPMRAGSGRRYRDGRLGAPRRPPRLRRPRPPLAAMVVTSPGARRGGSGATLLRSF